nr:MAG TPA: hypothetical protein [Caudoviricetes sp.]
MFLRMLIPNFDFGTSIFFEEIHVFSPHFISD